MIEFLTAWVICDYCRTRVYLGKPQDWEEYAETWCCGILDEYCPACKNLPEIRAEIDEEARLIGSFRDEPEEEFEFPEYIS